VKYLSFLARIGGEPEISTTASSCGSCRISPGVSKGRSVSWLDTVMCDSHTDSRRPDRFLCARCSVAVPSASDSRLAVRSSLGANTTRTWQLSRMA